MCAVYDLNADLSICRKHSLKDILMLYNFETVISDK